MRFQIASNLLGLLALYSVQIVAQDTASLETQVSAPVASVTEVISSVVAPTFSTEAPSPSNPGSDVNSITLEPTPSDEPNATSTPEPIQSDEPNATSTPEPTQSDEPNATSTPEPTQSDEPNATSTLEPTPSEEASDANPAEPTHTEEPSDSNPPEPTQSEGTDSPADPAASNSPPPVDDSPTTADPEHPQPTGAPAGDGECQEGQYKCADESSPAFHWCVSGKWSQNTCAEGTVCKAVEGDGIVCDWPDSE
ncbi:hypothetical protein K493DRAFT_407443 [Basidiobolus meristosporus CBS 931.73]|uniref:Chitin-binding type-2 domain-containing protein n=1 Tax=Basidiobolus meristosporus CBS 931.73 TaxID=1314790 RepID=A0A1Y1YE16_9FUNG|nr:hypothetical protein K493DRAFT_407443 [Basidiobolus meristosporus CBS 931.73]|eukprot:ORX95844.1 hypothetical protein K493DRAFT_407443 [Basidiobolus meristosporus CBS 931.73]